MLQKGWKMNFWACPARYLISLQIIQKLVGTLIHKGNWGLDDMNIWCWILMNRYWIKTSSRCAISDDTNFLRSLSSLAAFRPRSPSCQICFQFCSTFFTTVRISSVFTILSSLKSCNGCIWWLRMASPSHDHMVVEYVVVSCQIFFSWGVWSYYDWLYKRGIFVSETRLSVGVWLK